MEVAREGEGSCRWRKEGDSMSSFILDQVEGYAEMREARVKHIFRLHHSVLD